MKDKYVEKYEKYLKDLKEIDDTIYYLRKLQSFLKFEVCINNDYRKIAFLDELDRTIDMLVEYKNKFNISKRIEEINNQIFKYINVPLVTSDDFIKNAIKYLQY